MTERHTGFAPVLFDVLFGLVVFLGVEALFDLHGTRAVMLVVTSIGIVAHWWLKYKTDEETYALQAGTSAADLFFGLIEIVLLQQAIRAAVLGQAAIAAFYFSLPLLTEATWALLWRFCGTWRRTSRDRIRYMEQQLELTLFLNLGTAAAIGALIVNAPLLSSNGFLAIFIAIYATYAFLASRWELVDVKFI